MGMSVQTARARRGGSRRGGRPARDTAPPETAPPDTAGRDRAPADPSPTRSLRRPPAGDPTPTVRAPRSAPPADDDGEALPAGTPTRGPDPCSTTPPATPDRRWNVWAPVLALTGVAAVLSWVGVWFTDSSPCCSGFSRGDFERLPDLALLGVVLAAVGGVLTALRREVPWWGRLGVAVITLLVVAAWLHVLWEFDDRVLPFYEPDDGEAIGWGAWVSALIPLTAAPGLVLLALDVRRPRSPGSPR